MKRIIEYFSILFLCTFVMVVLWCIIAPELFVVNGFAMKYGHYIFIPLVSVVIASLLIKKFKFVDVKKTNRLSAFLYFTLLVTGVCVAFFLSLFILLLVFLHEANLFI